MLGCVLVSKNRVVAYAPNTDKTDPNAPIVYKEGSKIYHQSCHAEFAALKNLDGNWIRNKNKPPLFSHITLYVARLKANGTPAMARPCEHCQSLLKAYGIKTVVYTVSPNLLMVKEKL
jgi:tRNA(Arg) A34 adenosine deaminase TadA